MKKNFIILASVMVLMISCSSKSKILGSWKGSTTGITLSFFKDGSFSRGNWMATLSGTYSIPDSKTMIWVVQGDQEKVSFYFEGNNLICELPETGQKEIFIKAK